MWLTRDADVRATRRRGFSPAVSWSVRLGVAALALASVPVAGQTTAPAARPPDVILAEMADAQGRLKAAIGDPRALGDPARRAAVAPAAVPPLKRLIADKRELAVATAGRVAADLRFEVRLRAYLSALGDRESADRLAALAVDPQPATAVLGQAGQLLAEWVVVPTDPAGQSAVLDRLAPLDAAHPGDGDLARLTGLMAGSAATPAVRERLVGLLAPMTGPAADAARRSVGP